MASLPVRPKLLAPPPSAVEESFRRLAEEWRTATAYLSSMAAANSHPAYQAMIALGPAVLPLLLRDLEDNHTHWVETTRTGE